MVYVPVCLLVVGSVGSVGSVVVVVLERGCGGKLHGGVSLCMRNTRGGWPVFISLLLCLHDILFVADSAKSTCHIDRDITARCQY